MTKTLHTECLCPYLSSRLYIWKLQRNNFQQELKQINRTIAQLSELNPGPVIYHEVSFRLSTISHVYTGWKRCQLTGPSSAATSLSGGLSLRTLEGMCSLFSTSLSCWQLRCLCKEVEAKHQVWCNNKAIRMNATHSRVILINNIYSVHIVKAQ